MAFEALYTENIGIPYFAIGGKYSAEADRRRFFYLDYNLESYVGVIGVGVIEGFAITQIDDLKVEIGYGTAILSDFFSEAPFRVKERSTVLPSDIVIARGYYVVSTEDEIVEVEDPDLESDVGTLGTTTYYDQVLYQPEIQLLDNSDNYIYIYRNGSSIQDMPYYEPNVLSPTVESSSDRNSLHTAVGYGVTGSAGYANSSGRSLIGKVVTRDGAVSEIDTSDVVTLRGLQKSIIAFGQTYVVNHRHGGTGDYDPEKIILRTDRRDTTLESGNDSYSTYRILYSDPTSVDLGHKHYYFVDVDGDGYTVTVVGTVVMHYHEISNYVVGSPQGYDTDNPIDDHTHTLTISEDSPDTWDDETEDYQVYINDNAYYGSNESVSVTNKTITFTDDVTITKRRFSINKTFTDGTVYQFDSEEPTVFRFMLRVALDYYSIYSEEISTGQKTSLILPDPESPVDLLKDQCVVAEAMLVDVGDTFTFMGEVAPDPVTVTLMVAGHVDQVEVEVVANSEVTGELRAQNVLYIPAEKFTTGTFEVGRIPILSHMGRYLEECDFSFTRANSYDGRVWEVSDVIPWGNVKVVHSAHVDRYGNYLLGTSDGLYRYPVSGAYVFIINDVKVIVPYGDLKTQLKLAAKRYASIAGTTIAITDKVYDSQITSAETVLTSYGTHFEITGGYRTVDGELVYDEVHVYYVEGYKILDYGYETVRLETDILEGEEVVGLAPGEEEAIAEANEAAAESGTISQRVNSYVVKNDFNKSAVKRILVESNYADQYGGLDEIYFCVAADYISKSTDPDVHWSIVYQSSLMGYIKNIERTYSGYYMAITDNGLYFCPNTTSSEYRLIDLPSYDTTILAASHGFDDFVIMSYEGGCYYTLDYGSTWVNLSISDSIIEKIMFDPYDDKTSVISSHYHGLSLDYAGNGITEGMYDENGISISETHVHAVSSGSIATSNGHVHVGVRTFYAIDEIGVIYKSVGGMTWSSYSELPGSYGEVGLVTVAFGKVFVNTYESVIYTANGTTWVTMGDFDSPIHSGQWDDQNSVFYFGAVNELYSYDGTTVEKVIELNGTGLPSVKVDSVRRRFGYTINNFKRKIDFGEDVSLSSIDITYEFDECYPIHGPWSAGVTYDLYVNDKLVKSTRDNYYITGTKKAVVSNSGVINFLVSTGLSSILNYGDEQVVLSDASDFPDSGTIRLTWAGDYYTNCVFLEYDSKSGNTLYLSFPSQYKIEVETETTDDNGNTTTEEIDVTVKSMNSLGQDDDILITIYEGKITNVGENTHREIEDYLSTENMGSGKRFSDIYFSNLMHMTAAMSYVMTGIGDDFKNYFVTIFNYNDIPGDPDNIDRFIDRTTSDLFSQVLHESTFLPSVSTKINRAIFGFGDFSDILFVATDVGLFIAKINLGYEANWFRVNIDDSVSSYDVLQTRSGQVLVCTDKGMYQNDDSTLSAWTIYNPNIIGGTPLIISPRWANIGAYNNANDYWWQGWEQITHENEDLVNSIIISGLGFASVTDDYGGVWQKSYLKDSSGTLIEGNFTMTEPGILHNGTTLSCLKDLDNDRAFVMYSTGTGITWNGTFEFMTYTAKVVGYSLTDYNNINLRLSYIGEAPASGMLRGLNLYLNRAEFGIIENDQNGITVFGSSIVDSITGNSNTDIISVPPSTMNVVSEIPGGTILLGTSNGILSDKGVFLSSRSASSGIVKSVGVKATVESLNISGVIKSLVFQTSAKTMISVDLDRIVKANQMAGYTLKFSGATDMTVVSNEASKVDGLTSVVVTCDWVSIASGLEFSAISENNIVYVSFNSIVAPGELEGGKLYVEPEPTSLTPVSSSVHQFTIISNGSDYIEISYDSTEQLPEVSWNYVFFPGTVIYATLSDGTVPIYVDFVEKPAVGSLRGNSIEITDISENLAKITVDVIDNKETVLYVPRNFDAAISVNGFTGNTQRNFIVYNAIFEGTVFILAEASFESDEAFNSRLTTIDNDHYHDIDLFGSEISGSIASIGSSTSTYVDLNISGTTALSGEPFVSRNTLLSGAEMVVWDPENYDRLFRLTIVSTTGSSIRVENSGDIFNTSGTSPRKVSSDYYFLIDASRYGVSTEVNFTTDFVVAKGYITNDTYLQGDTIYVSDSSVFTVGETIVLRDRDGLEFKTSVSSIPTPTTMMISDELPFDLTVLKNSYYEVLFTNLVIGSYLLTATMNIDTDQATVSDTSLINSGDTVVFTDDKGLLFTSKVSSIDSPTTFSTEDVSDATFTVVDGAKVVVKRDNVSDSHVHVVKSGEFERKSDSYWYSRGYNYYHSHMISPLVKEVYDIEVMHSKTYVVGNSSRIYTSSDSGNSWVPEVDFEDIGEYYPVPEKITKVTTNGNDIVFCTNSGYLVYFSTKIPNVTVPLELPIG